MSCPVRIPYCSSRRMLLKQFRREMDLYLQRSWKDLFRLRISILLVLPIIREMTVVKYRIAGDGRCLRAHICVGIGSRIVRQEGGGIQYESRLHVSGSFKKFTKVTQKGNRREIGRIMQRVTLLKDGNNFTGFPLRRKMTIFKICIGEVCQLLNKRRSKVFQSIDRKVIRSGDFCVDRDLNDVRDCGIKINPPVCKYKHQAGDFSIYRFSDC